MQAQPVDERDVGQEVDIDVYRVIFWDMRRSSSSAYNLLGVEHVADVLTWVRQQVGPDGPHAGSHPEIGALLGKTPKTFIRLTPDYWGLSSQDSPVPAPPFD